MRISAFFLLLASVFPVISFAQTQINCNNDTLKSCLSKLIERVNELSSVNTQLQQQLTNEQNKHIPSRAIIAFNLETCPAGWIPANGGQNTPDLRGEFVRGLDSGRGVDANRTLSSSQIATHILLDDDQQHVVGAIGYNQTLAEFGYEEPASIPNHLTVLLSYVTAAHSAAVPTSAFTKTIRPRNVALLYCMKI
ncbi:MAG: tail fiber protein [Oligoflexia bacterium]|nr:tail fiber protein [Oligoflexia bacterium]